MGGLFSSPKIPKPPTPPAPPAPPVAPTIDNARDKAMAEDAYAKRRGMAANILTGQKGDLAAPPTSTKTLLGS